MQKKSKEKVKNTKIVTEGILSMFSRFWTSVLFWARFWRFEYDLHIRSSSRTNEKVDHFESLIVPKNVKGETLFYA